ncbi:LysR family transcriptional regulator [Kitasatospora sp. CM 4170]|uniref:LysR family transcriptional regulator n=1 Tax=Kitasatospora aburaviensis TaxID=67265 RepID=A0ABW1EWY6_9ACTN|nr:LysR family transcriptional regulator [Kitasatospora sp. CM 4170]WNM46756.1 LysR family transcriptional regulator [Kitasatospora sp. CM 4170]
MALSPRVPELGALELLLAVARLGSVGRAAAELGVSQPTASARIKGMERQIGVPLLDRSPRGSRPTEAGRLVVEWARHVVEAAQSLDAGIDALRERRDARLVVVASLTVAEYLMPGWLLALHEASPGTAVTLRTANSADVAGHVLAGEADLGFVEGPSTPAGLAGAVVAADRLVVVVAPDHPWARRRAPLTGEELAATPLVLREPGSGTREVLEMALAPFGGAARPRLELASSTALKAAAMTGAGPVCLSELAVVEELATRRLVAVPLAEGLDLRRPLRAVWPAGQRPGGPARELLTLTRRTAGPLRPHRSGAVHRKVSES